MSYKHLVNAFLEKNNVSHIPESPANVTVQSVETAEAKNGHIAHKVSFKFKDVSNSRVYVVYHVDSINPSKQIQVGNSYCLSFNGAGIFRETSRITYKRAEGCDFYSEYSFTEPMINSPSSKKIAHP